MFSIIKHAITLLLASVSLSHATTKSVCKVWQPLSLYGTDVVSVLGAESGVDYAVVLSRPMVLSGALPEALIYAVVSRHKMATNSSYSEEEANLAKLYNFTIETNYEGNQLEVSVDTSKVVQPPYVDVSKEDALKLTVTALQMTIEEYGKAYLESPMKCSIKVVGAESAEQSAMWQKFNISFVVAPEVKAEDK